MKTKTSMLLGAILALFIISACNSASASYVNLDLIDYVDGSKDPFYTQIYEKSNLTISLAYDNSSNLLFINYTMQIQLLQIDSLLISGDSESMMHRVKFTQVTYVNQSTYYYVEIWLDRTNVVSADNEYYIQINNELPFRLTVTITLPEPPQEPEPEEPPFDPNFLSFIAILAAIIAVISIRLFFLFSKPYCYFRVNNEYNCVCLGRYVDSEFDERLQKWKHYFKSSDGIFEAYSNLTYYDLKNFSLNVKNFLLARITGFHQLSPHVIMKKIGIPGNVEIKKKELDTRKKGKKILYEFLSFLPMKSSVYNLYKEIYVETNENLKEITYLELEYSQDTLEFKFDTSYEILELDSEGKQIWTKKKESDIDYSKILALQKSNIKDLKYTFTTAQIRKFNSIREAIQNRDSQDTLKSKFIEKELELSAQNKKLSDENFDLYQQNRDLKDSFNAKLVENLRKFAQRSESLNQKLPEVIGEVFYQRQLGMKDEESFAKGLKQINEIDKNSKNDTKSSEILEQNRILLDKIALLEKKIDNKSLIGGDIEV